ncbi:MAG: hypothetical protein WBJ37_05840 [Bacteroidales bacterium]
MEILRDILLVTIPSLIVFFTAYFLLKNLIRNDQDKRKQEIILQSNRTITPIRLQAYERLVLFLERISLESLIIRVHSPGMTAAQLQANLLTTIRSEFEHNLSQQIYVSPQAWEVVKNARSNIVKLINTEFEKLPENATGIDFSRRLLEKVMELEKEPTKAAVEFVKSEAARLIM